MYIYNYTYLLYTINYTFKLRNKKKQTQETQNLSKVIFRF